MVGYELLAEPQRDLSAEEAVERPPRRMTVVVRAPGRVNLIGEHTDYNDGFVFPMAIDRHTVVEADARDDRIVTIDAVDLLERDEFKLGAIEPTRSWRDYVRGIARSIDPEHGADLRIKSDIPRGAGLSSSAALLVAAGRAFAPELPGEELALTAQRAENEFVGVRTGIMDQFTVALAREDHALLLDCRDLSYRHISIPDGVTIVVADSRMERRLVRSAYNERRAACEEAARRLGVRALRDATLDQIESLPEDLRTRARHVVSENERTVAAAAELEAGNLAAVGELMDDSHRSMRDDYGIVPPLLDELAAAARSVDGCYGSRLTGAGFGGCTVSLVADGAFADVRAALEQLGAAVYRCRADGGVKSSIR
jgi:galactokinase